MVDGQSAAAVLRGGGGPEPALLAELAAELAVLRVVLVRVLVALDLRDVVAAAVNAMQWAGSGLVECRQHLNAEGAGYLAGTPVV